MITFDAAREIAEAHLRKRFAPTLAGHIVLLDQETIEKDYGWIFFYQHKKWIETGKTRDGLIGNSPFLVERATGRIVKFGSAGSIEYWCQRYESSPLEVDSEGIGHLR
jgi:hypothetical protein